MGSDNPMLWLSDKSKAFKERYMSSSECQLATPNPMYCVKFGDFNSLTVPAVLVTQNPDRSKLDPKKVNISEIKLLFINNLNLFNTFIFWNSPDDNDMKQSYHVANLCGAFLLFNKLILP
jgi:hypothetical protein